MGLPMNIALLKTKILERLQKWDISFHETSESTIQIVSGEMILDISLQNLHRSIQERPQATNELINTFLTRIRSHLTNTRDVGEVYPRLLKPPEYKSTAYPWAQPFLGNHLEVSLIEHHSGRLQFLSPFQVVSRDGGLRALKKKAIANLYQILPQVEWQTIGPRTWKAEHPEVLTSSLVLLADQVSMFKGQSVIQFAVPNRGTLWLSVASLEPFLFEIQQDFQRGEHPIAKDIFQVTTNAILNFRNSWAEQ